MAGYKLKQTEIMSQHMMRRTPLCSDDGQSEINQVSAPQYVPTALRQTKLQRIIFDCASFKRVLNEQVNAGEFLYL